MPINQIYYTERLILRTTLEEDAAFILALLNTPKWIQFIGDRNVKSIESAIDYINIKMLPQLIRLGFSNYTVIRKEDNAKIGTCGLYDREGLEGIDIGFAFLPEYENNGYGFESAQMIKKLAFEHFNIKEINAITLKENIASQKLLIKLGLKRHGTVILPNGDEELLLYKMLME